MQDNRPIESDNIENDNDEKRREFLKKLGKFAVVAPPVIVTLMSSEVRSAQSCPGGGDQPYN